MTRNPIKPIKLGYTLETRICLTPDLSDEFHTHVTIHIDAATLTGDKDEVLAKAYADFKSLLRHLQDEDGVPSFKRFKDLLYNVNLHQVVTNCGEVTWLPTHASPEKIQ